MQFAKYLLALTFLTATTATGAVPAGRPARGNSELVLPAPKAGRVHRLVAVIADNAGAETTDFTVPYGVLKESGVADVVSLSTLHGPVRLMPALKIRADRTLAEFDASTPRGADIVIVPAMRNDKNPRIIAWLRAQYKKGATIVSICTGAYVVGRAGLLDGRQATSHWHALSDLEQTFPKTRWVRNRRYVQDGRVITTTGVTASIPVSLALVEAMAGHSAALHTAQRMGVTDWSAAHRSADFSLTLRRIALVGSHYVSFWRHETIEAPVKTGFDEIGLALSSDAWTQSFLADVATTSANGQPVVSRHGLILLADSAPVAGRFVMPGYSGPSLLALDHALADIDRRYGTETGDFAALSVEYPRPRKSSVRM